MNSVKQAPKSPTISSPLLAGVIFSLIWLAAGALLLSLLLHLTSIKESNISQYTLIIHAVSALAGGFTAGKRSDHKGWYNGGMLGLLYGLIVIMISFLASDISISMQSVLLLGAVLLAGSFGGMIGVNLKR